MPRKKKISKKKSGSKSIAAGEYENDAVSSGSTGTSRSLGWGTFTDTGVDAGGAGAGSAPGDYETRGRGAGGGGLALGASVPVYSAPAAAAAGASLPEGDDEAAAARASPVQSDGYFDAKQQAEDAPQDSSTSAAAAAAAASATKQEEGDKKPAASTTTTTAAADAPVRLAAADFFSGPQIQVNDDDDNDDKKKTSGDDNDNTKGAVLAGAAVGAAAAAVAAAAAGESKAQEEDAAAAAAAAKTGALQVKTEGSLSKIASSLRNVLSPSSSPKEPSKESKSEKENKADEDEENTKGSNKEEKDGDKDGAVAGASLAGAAVGAGAAAAAAAAAASAADESKEAEDSESGTDTASHTGTISSIAASIPFLGSVLGNGKDKSAAADADTENASSTSNKNSGDADGGATKSRDLETPEKDKSRGVALAAPLVATAPGTPPEEDENQTSRAAAAAGGAGAAALVMSRGLPGLGPGSSDAADTSDTSSQHHNYLPSDLGGAKGIKGDGNAPRELQDPVPTGDEGAFDTATRDLKIGSVNKSRDGIGGDDVSEGLTDEEEHRRRRNRLFAILAFCWCCLILLAVLATLLAVYLGDDDDNENRGGSPPIVPSFTFSPTASPTPMPTVGQTLSPAGLEDLETLDGGISEELFGSSLAFSRDGNVLAVGGLDGWSVYDSAGDDLTSWAERSEAENRLRKRRFLRQLQANNGGALVGLSANGDTVAVADLGGTRVRMYRWSSTFESWALIGNEVTEFTLTKVIESLVVSASGQTIAVGGGGALQVFHYIPGGDRWFPRGPLLQPPDLAEEAVGPSVGSKIALSLDGKRLVTPTSEEGELTVFAWDYGTNDWAPMGAPIPAPATAETRGKIDAVCMSSSGTVVAYGSLGVVRVYSYVDGTWVQLGKEMTGSEASFGTALAMDAEASLLIVGAGDSDVELGNAGEVRFYGYNGDQWVKVYETMHGAEAGDHWGTSVAISSDGRVIAISADRRSNPLKRGYVGLYQRGG